jgi:N-acetylmuramoyl-L-alanine amidase CwlA
MCHFHTASKSTLGWISDEDIHCNECTFLLPGGTRAVQSCHAAQRGLCRGHEAGTQPSKPNLQSKPSKPNLQFKPSKPNLQTKPYKQNLLSKPSKPNQQPKQSKPNIQSKPSKPNLQTKPSKPNNHESHPNI